MKVLVATLRTQGVLANDYSSCVPGELLWITEVCAQDRRDPEQGCGCGRAFGGLTSHRATTTAEVIESGITEDELKLAIRTSLTDQGWIPEALPERDQQAIVEEVAAELRDLTDSVPAGSLVRRHLDEVRIFPPEAA